MLKIGTLLLAASILLCLDSAMANPWRNSAVGDWNFVWVEQAGKKRDTYRGTQKYWKLADGTFRWRNIFKLQKGKSYKSEGWEYPDGKLKITDYQDGRVFGRGTGSWEMKGKKMLHTTRFKSLDGTLIYKGHTEFVDRNRSVTRVTVAPGRVKVTVTYTRAKR